MIWLIAKKDFLLNLLSVRFIIGFMLCLVIIPFTIVVSVDNYRDQLRVYNLEKENTENKFKEIRVWSGLKPTIVKEPIALSIFSSGISQNVGSNVMIKFSEYPLFPYGHSTTRDNPLLNAFFSIDFSKVIAILISLIALVFAYDAITRERENGTMKLTFTGRVSRITFLFGKLLGLMLTLLPILIFCYLLACLVVLVNPEIAFTASDWGGIFILFLTSVVYMLVFILIGMLISSLVTHSSSAIILSLLSWIWFLFLMPNISTYLSQSIVKTPLYDNVASAMNEENKAYWKEYQEMSKQIKEEQGLEYLWHWNMSGGDDGSIEISGNSRDVTDYYLRLTSWTAPVIFSYADKKWALQRAYLDELIKQQKWQSRIAWLSPSELFGQTTETLCRTDMPSFLNYMESIRQYRETYIRYYLDKKLFESTLFFTPQRYEDFLTREEIDKIGWDNYGGLFDEIRKTFTPLNIDDVPRFAPQKSSIAGALGDAFGRLSGLLGLMLVLLIATIASFMKYDVR